MAASVLLSAETIALTTEKKLDMALDDIIKMSKKASFKGKQASRTPNKSRRFMKDRGIQRNSKVLRFMNSRSSIRQDGQKKPKTLDALFSDMKEQRIRMISRRHRRARGGQQQRRGYKKVVALAAELAISLLEIL